jgi:hypothetical protein
LTISSLPQLGQRTGSRTIGFILTENALPVSQNPHV